MRPLHRALLVAGIVVGLAACPNGDSERDYRTSDGNRDKGTCGTRPPTIAECHAPPNMYSKNLYYCQCTGYCNGGPSTAACNGTNGDCRYFYDSCIPMSYMACNSLATDQVLGLCGACFFRETGAGSPKYCDKISTDLGVPREAGRDASKPKEGGPKDGPGKS